MTKPRIGFIGLGAMGEPMVRRLAGAGYEVIALDVDRQRCEAMAVDIAGVRSANDPVDLAHNAQVVITMLPNSNVVESALFGTAGIAQHASPGTIFIEMGSGAPGHTVKLAERVATSGMNMIDAPVSGGVPRAVSGELTIMAGGDPLVIDTVEPILNAMGNSIFRTGAIGTGHAMKALNNLVSAGGFLIGIEALVIGSKFGLEPDLMVDVLNASTGMNNSTQKKFKQQVLSRAFASGFSLDLLVKDINAALQVAQETGSDAPFSSLCGEIWAKAKASGLGSDHTDLARLYEESNSLTLTSSPSSER